MATKNARSPRRVRMDHEALQAIPLNDKAPPPDDSVGWRLWTSCADLAQEALKTDYMQGIKNGTLDPNQYGQYTLQDAVYCHHAQDDYQTMESRATADGYPELAAFAKARQDSYASYNADTFKSWHIKNADALMPGKAAQTYIDFEHLIATEWQPIYGVIAMIPCDQLWPYLATELKDDATAGNLYSFWIKENGDWGGSYRMDNFIDAWFAEHEDVYDWGSALFVFRSCMTCEVNFFKSACGQDLLPMPKRSDF